MAKQQPDSDGSHTLPKDNFSIVSHSVPSPDDGPQNLANGPGVGQALLPTLAANNVVFSSSLHQVRSCQLASVGSLSNRLINLKAFPPQGCGYDVATMGMLGLVNSFIVHKPPSGLDHDLAVAVALGHVICSATLDVQLWSWSGLDSLLMKLSHAGQVHGSWPIDSIGVIEAICLARSIVTDRHLYNTRFLMSSLKPEVSKKEFFRSCVHVIFGSIYT